MYARTVFYKINTTEPLNPEAAVLWVPDLLLSSIIHACKFFTKVIHSLCDEKTTLIWTVFMLLFGQGHSLGLQLRFFFVD